MPLRVQRDGTCYGTKGDDIFYLCTYAACISVQANTGDGSRPSPLKAPFFSVLSSWYD